MASKYVKASAFTNGIGALDQQRQSNVIICGFLVNGLVDSYQGEGDIQATLSTTIAIYTNAIKLAQERSKSRIFVIDPIVRPHPAWLKESIQWISDTLRAKLEGCEMVELLTSPKIPEQLFETDRIHLNELGLSMMHAHFMAVCPVLKKAADMIVRALVGDISDMETDQQSTRKRGASPIHSTATKSQRVVVERENGMLSEEDEDNVTVVIRNDPNAQLIDTVKNTISMEMSKFMETQNKTNRNVSNSIHLINKELFCNGKHRMKQSTEPIPI